MCPGTIKILRTQGSIETKGDEHGLSVVLGSPIDAGCRLYQQAMDSIHRKREITKEVHRQRDLLAEPSIHYSGLKTKTKDLLISQQEYQTLELKQVPEYPLDQAIPNDCFRRGV